MMLKCKQCEKKLSLNEFIKGNFKKVLDVDLHKVGLFCKEHGEIVESELKAKRFVEKYKNNDIYCKGGKYVIYWECHYYFENIEDARKRIDDTHVAIMVF